MIPLPIIENKPQQFSVSHFQKQAYGKAPYLVKAISLNNEAFFLNPVRLVLVTASAL